MTRSLAALAVLLVEIWNPALAQPRIYAIGLAVTDGITASALPAHLQSLHPRLVADLRSQARSLLAQLGRVQILDWDAAFSANRYLYGGAGEVDYVVHLLLLHAGKVYSNRVLYDNQMMMGLPAGYGGQEAGLDYEIVSLPAISDRLEIRLVDPHREKVLWSAQRDSTATVPFDPQGFILNPRKYPGLTPPRLLRDNLVDLMRLRQNNRGVDRLLDVADRWFVSSPAADVEVSQELLGGLVLSLAADLDRNLPIEGRITQILPSEAGVPRVQLGLGARHGLVPAMRLEVWRPLPATQKVGEVEVVAVDSLSATARLRRLDRKIRKQGDGLQLWDRVISPKRLSPREEK